MSVVPPVPVPPLASLPRWLLPQLLTLAALGISTKKFRLTVPLLLALR